MTVCITSEENAVSIWTKQHKISVSVRVYWLWRTQEACNSWQKLHIVFSKRADREHESLCSESSSINVVYWQLTMVQHPSGHNHKIDLVINSFRIITLDLKWVNFQLYASFNKYVLTFCTFSWNFWATGTWLRFRKILILTKGQLKIFSSLFYCFHKKPLYYSGKFK